MCVSPVLQAMCHGCSEGCEAVPDRRGRADRGELPDVLWGLAAGPAPKSSAVPALRRGSLGSQLFMVLIEIFCF